MVMLFDRSLNLHYNITWFCIWYDNDWGKIYINGYIHKRHPIARPHGRAMGCPLWGLGWQFTALWRHRAVCGNKNHNSSVHYNDVIMTTIASQITNLTVVYSTVYSDADQRKHQSSASLAFLWGIHRDRWIPRTKGQLRGKCFHLMTSSWFRWHSMAGFCFNLVEYHMIIHRAQHIYLNFIRKKMLWKRPDIVTNVLCKTWCVNHDLI